MFNRLYKPITKCNRLYTRSCLIYEYVYSRIDLWCMLRTGGTIAPNSLADECVLYVGESTSDSSCRYLFIYYLLFNFWVSEWFVLIYIHIFTDKCVLSICGWIDVKLFMLLLGYLIFIVFFSLFIYSFIYLRAIYMWVNRHQTLHVAICLWNIHFCFVFVFIYIFVRYLYVGESTSNSSCCYSFF